MLLPNPNGKLFACIVALAAGCVLVPAIGCGSDVASNAAMPASPFAWFDEEKLNVLVAILTFSGLFFGFLFYSRRGKLLYLRRIPGIAEMEEAIGRATEMGRPVLFIPGIDDINEIQTLAGIVVLGHVAQIVARYDSEVLVPTRAALVLSVCEETVRQAFAAAGRPDAYKADNLLYLSDDQFAFTAGVDGLILRRHPAAAIYMGSFYAESLVLAETGQASGAIQVAGTASITQLPFFVAACDYTLLAEEFYAASAYLSRDPKVLASIKASDFFKVLILVILVLGMLLVAFGPGAAKTLEYLKNWF